MSLGIIAGFLVLYLNTRSLKKDEFKKIILFALIIFIPFVIGGRLGYIIECFIRKQPVCTALGLYGPASLWWGLALATLCAFPIARLLKTNEWVAADYFALSISIGGFFTRLGCLFNGCCKGKVCPPEFPLATHFPYTNLSGTELVGKTLHPSQLYSALAWLLVFMILILRKNKKGFHGELILIMAFSYSFCRFFIEFFRYYEISHFPTIAQIWSFIIIIISTILYFVFKKYRINKVS